MRSLPFLDASTLTSLVSSHQAQAALERALSGGLGRPGSLPRVAVPTRSGELLLMPAESVDAVGVKLLGIAPDNPSAGLPRIQGLYVLFDADTLTPQLLIDGSALTLLRTPAVSTLAVQHLAPPNAQVLTIFGAGPQSKAHVQAITAIRPISAVRVVGRRTEAAAALCQTLRADGIAADPGTEQDVADADIIVCATTSAVPLFPGELLTEHACVVAIGSHQRGVRELDEQVFARASRVVVEDCETALREAGDVISAIDCATLTTSDLTDMVQMLCAPSPQGVSVFKSVGMGWQDLAVAEAAHAAWLSGAPA
ncbi:MAG: ornithine cyclodeaminase family protein [Actinomycetota bacterium]|nr:ornithine cyclodeaminase family protein [Actinomycetota bacterium]